MFYFRNNFFFYFYAFLDYPYKEIVTKKIFKQKKKWLDDLNDMEVEENKTMVNNKRSIINENC